MEERKKERVKGGGARENTIFLRKQAVVSVAVSHSPLFGNSVIKHNIRGRGGGRGDVGRMCYRLCLVISLRLAITDRAITCQ